jgi:hypothetical protein
MKQPRDLTSIRKLLSDKKSGFSLFVKRNNGLKTLKRDHIPGDLVELYDFYLSEDPEWDRRMATLNEAMRLHLRGHSLGDNRLKGHL